MSGGTGIEYEELYDIFELIQEEFPSEQDVFCPEQTMWIASMCCVGVEDRVLIDAQEIMKLLIVIAYQYQPRKLVVLNDTGSLRCYETERDKIRLFVAVTKEAKTMKAVYLNQSLSTLSFKNNQFDVIVFADYRKEILTAVNDSGRFDLVKGKEYEDYVNAVRQSSRRLESDGRLIVLCRICWILCSWQLLEECHLQFEYQDYHYYVKQNPNQNDFVWLRFTYKAEGIEADRQKRNMEQYMEENHIDRLYAHRNQCLYPYTSLPDQPEEAYVQLNQKREVLQYFFTAKTTEQLAMLCEGNTACLVVPSVAVCAFDQGRQVTLFEQDHRFRVNGGVKFVKYDLYKGLNQVNRRKYEQRFQTVICDPPFNIDLSVLAGDIRELLLSSEQSVVYVIYPAGRSSLLCNAMQKQKMQLEEAAFLPIEYAVPPKLVRQEGANAIQIYRFRIMRL